MKNLIEKLKEQLINYSDLSYAKDSGYVADDPMRLIQINKFPFFNIMPESERIEKVDGVSFKEMERHIYTIVIQFATRSMKMNVAVMGEDDKKGILDFANDIWSAVISDRKVGNSVGGILPGYTISTDVLLEEGEETYFISGAEMRLEFFADRVVA